MSFDFTTLLQEVFPDSDLGAIDEVGDLAKLFEGMAEDYQAIYDVLMNLAHVRDPRLASLLSDLEREFGIVPDTSISDAVRRQMLAHVIYQRPTTASWKNLELALIDAGFSNLLVTQNNPMVDPSVVGGDLLVNGTIYTSQSPAYYACMGSGIAYMGHSRAFMGYYLSDNKVAKTYTIPTGPPYWPWAFVFWVGGAASGWPGTPAVALANIDAQRETQLKNLILKYKPAFTWCMLRVTFV